MREKIKKEWWIDKWKGKYNYYDRRRKIKRTTMNWELKWKVQLLCKKKKDQKKDGELISERGNKTIMRAEKGPKERCWIEKWNGKWNCCEKRKRVKKDYELRSQMESAILMREEKESKKMMNWEMKGEIQQLWEKKDQKNDDKLRNEIVIEIVLREEEGSKKDDGLRSKMWNVNIMRKEEESK
jgi:hypothetical protein